MAAMARARPVRDLAADPRHGRAGHFDAFAETAMDSPESLTMVP
jgi:hypothetical protein